MQLTTLDWIVIALYGLTALAIGLRFARRAGSGADEFFLSGRKLPWWLLGTSMVATTFSTDTPNLVADFVRTGGVAQNWSWWAFLITGMLTVFFYARLWRRSGALTDIEFYELRYSGRPAAFLRGFRALYLGVFYNVVIIATVTLAATKIGGVLLGLDPLTTVLIAGSVTMLYSATSGLWGVVATDLLLFVIAMIGSIAAAVFALQQPEVGGLAGLVSNPDLQSAMRFFPDFSDWSVAMGIFIIPIAVQWWSAWYPGAEPGGGGYVAQRMLAAKDEREAMKATLWFNIAHYGLRPWPWIIVALCSMVIYPELSDIQARFPDLDPSLVGNDLAYPAMLVFLPAGLLGLVVASLAAAYMSTISTQLNWGSSYVVNDFYRRFWNQGASDRQLVAVGRLSTVGLMVLGAFVALQLDTAGQGFQILLQIGAGTGLIFLLRWFWYRVNVWSELSGMTISFLAAFYFAFGHQQLLGFDPLPASMQLVIGVAVTTVVWVGVTLVTPPASRETLQAFYDRIQPMGKGWERVVRVGDGPRDAGTITASFLAWFLGCVLVYAALFGTGYLLYGQFHWAVLALGVSAAAGVWLFRLLPRIGY
ncbi:MAG: Na+:solute symporter [Gemmatimonadetes bacterium]|nr:Na+:solute symporter [Gemmatimonadota bacterium]MYD14182.1 Na+:solute symporter [Gemmatimonadota bacterium]MYI65441.1 Na+:solute symporter [Gemmatimonadota bacterium]